jgi:hypothetical protein
VASSVPRLDCPLLHRELFLWLDQPGDGFLFQATAATKGGNNVDAAAAAAAAQGGNDA